MTMMPVSSQLTSTATSEGGQELSPLRMVRVQSPAALLSGVLGRDPPQRVPVVTILVTWAPRGAIFLRGKGTMAQGLPGRTI